MLNRLKSARPRMEDMGHKIRFSVSRGPLNVATFLMGTTEFLMALKTDPDKAHKLLRIITSFLKQWHALQRETFPTIDGIFMLDDIVGFIGEEDFKEFGLPYFKELYAGDVAVKFFHNDAECAKSIGYYPEIGINLYNPGIFNTLAELRQMSRQSACHPRQHPPARCAGQRLAGRRAGGGAASSWRRRLTDRGSSSPAPAACRRA